MHRVIFMALVAVFGTGLTPAAAAPATRPTYTHAARDVVQSYRLDEEWGLEASATHVEGTGVGAGCTEGHWHRQAVELLQTGSSEDFANLVRERSLSLRTLGVYCLARTGGEQPAAILRSLFADETKIQVCYGGCIVRSTTLGVFAEEMAWNSQFLEGGFKPALPPQELMVRAITRVDTVARGFESRGGVPPGRYFALIGQLIAWDSSDK